MRASIWLLVLGCGLMLSTSGCCGGCMRGGDYGCDPCGSDGGCGPSCGLVRHRVYADDCGGGCNTCRSGCNTCDGCDSCGDDCGNCCQRNFCFHPFRWIGRIFWTRTWCGSGCGEPCDSCGGCDSCGQGGVVTGHPGCSSCNHGGAAYDDGDMSPMQGGDVMQGDSSGVPTPAPKSSSKATRRQPRYSYQR